MKLQGKITKELGRCGVMYAVLQDIAVFPDPDDHLCFGEDEAALIDCLRFHQFLKPDLEVYCELPLECEAGDIVEMWANVEFVAARFCVVESQLLSLGLSENHYTNKVERLLRYVQDAD